MLAGLTGLSACGGGSPKVILNTERVERAIEASIKTQRHLTAAVTCPVNIEQKKGNNFTCFATVNGKSYPFRVTQTDGKGHVTYIGT
jgi:hypothetical protein